VRLAIAIGMAALVADEARAELVTRVVEYQHEGTALKGYLAYDGSISGRRPGVLVIHEWWGLNDYARMRADMLARMGFVALAADMYGGGMVAENRDHAATLSGQFMGQPLIRTRARAGLDVLAGHELVDPKRLAAIGYCFGGTTVLQLAYSGAELAGVVSFHGGLPAPQPDDYGRIKARVLLAHGADDPFVSADTIAAFQKGMRESGADWQMIYYGKAMHSFTNPQAGGANIRGAAYDKLADERCWGHMKVFFDEIFAK